jgi:hypothetical protein
MSAISAHKSGIAAHPGATHHAVGGTRIFGIPVGDFGLFASTLIAVALGFIAFFGVTFLSIFGVMIYNGAGGHHVTLDASYKYLGLPAGIVVLVLSLAALLGIWLRRKVTGR